jgi:hypothetical protein
VRFSLLIFFIKFSLLHFLYQIFFINFLYYIFFMKFSLLNFFIKFSLLNNPVNADEFPLMAVINVYICFLFITKCPPQKLKIYRKFLNVLKWNYDILSGKKKEIYGINLLKCNSRRQLLIINHNKSVFFVFDIITQRNS